MTERIHITINLKPLNSYYLSSTSQASYG